MIHWKIYTCCNCKQVTNEINPLSTLLCYVFLTIVKFVHLHSVLINLRSHVSSNCKKVLYQNYTQTLIQYGQRLFHVLQIVLKARGVFLHSKALYEIHNMISTRKTKRIDHPMIQKMYHLKIMYAHWVVLPPFWTDIRNLFRKFASFFVANQKLIIN